MSVKDGTTKDLNLIGEGTVIEGKLKSQGSVRIDGRIVGDIIAHEAVAVGPTGDIEGSVSAKTITVGGKIKGSIAAQEKLVFQSQAVVRGDIRAAKLVIDEGALFDGKCAMTREETVHAKPDNAASVQRDARPSLSAIEQKR